MPVAHEQWKKAGLTFGLQHPFPYDDEKPRVGKPWRRLLLCQGLSTVPECHGKSSGAYSEAFGSLPNLPYICKGNGCDEKIEEGLALHLSCNLRGSQAGSIDAKDVISFHVVFYELINLQDLPAQREAWDTYAFYGREDSAYLRKSCFTMISIPPHAKMPYHKSIHWTMICLTPTSFWPTEASYSDQSAPFLATQSLQYVARTLRDVCQRWRTILEALENVVDNRTFFQDPENWGDSLFDDDAFSTSKKYFWAINFLHEFLHLIDDNIIQWEQYRKAYVDAEIRVSRPEDDKYVKQSNKALETYEIQATKACSELRSLRQAFSEKLEQVKVMRDGLFNASAVMETRASTRLGQNMKLLTFVSIFFLPLSFCMSIWSINETYSRPVLVIITVLVGLTTYSVTLNLNNLTQFIRDVYLPRRRLLVRRMEQSATWSQTARRFKVFQGSESRLSEPSEWIVLAFFLRQLLLSIWKGTVYRPGPSKKVETYTADNSEVVDEIIDPNPRRDPES
ncbi:hypothetical protein HFD88_005823 [Aspergillus terreus]|nr:hypothetical protein HFD88_005823 [Aspergillus terreus]